MHRIEGETPMIEAPEMMRIAQELARHSGARQSVIASNIANSDTPGYKARDLPSFDTILESGGQPLRQTRPGHFPTSSRSTGIETVQGDGTPSPNGNTVSLEYEMVKATRASSDHTLALTVYRSSLDIMRTTLGRGR